MRYAWAMRSPVVLLSLFCIFLCVPAAAQDQAITEVYRNYLQQGVDTGAYQQVAAGWIDGTQTHTWFFGSHAKPDANSVFEIGAVTEVFTGLLLAQAAYTGKLQLDAALGTLLPAELNNASLTLRSLHVRDLATHRSGLPAVPANLFPAQVADPYAAYTTQDLFAFLSSYRPPTAALGYSPLNAALLGELLGRAYAKPYASALTATILRPLGLTHTGFDDTRLLQGYAFGQAVAHWHFSALAASAGLRSTLGDLLVFLQHNLQPHVSPLRAALLLARQPQFGSGKQDAGLGWHIVDVADGEQTWPLVWRASVTAGFSVFIGFRTDRQQALVLLGNTNADLSALGISWLKGDDLPPPPPPPPKPVPTSQLAAYPGLYQVRDGTEVVVRASASGLTGQLRAQPATALQVVTDDVFVATDATFVLSFQRDGETVKSLLLSHSGMNFLARRLSQGAPLVVRKPIAVDAGKLREFTADYRLDAGSLVQVTASGDGLRMQMTGRALAPLFAFATDRFSTRDDSCELTFRRDSGGVISAVSLDFAGGVREATRLGSSAQGPAAK